METLNKETKERIINFIREIEITPFGKFYILHHNNNFIVLRPAEDETALKIYIIGKKVYQETVQIFPLFSLSEIEEALNYKIECENAIKKKITNRKEV